MKVKVLCATDEDRYMYEEYYRLKSKAELDISYDSQSLNHDNARNITKDADALVVLTSCHIDEYIVQIIKENGVKYVVTRSAGTDHLDVKALKTAGIKVSNVPIYSPNAISEYACMLLLMLVRNMKLQLHKVEAGNYTLSGLKGKELKDMTIGVIGTGRIGARTVTLMSSLAGNVLAYDIHANDSVEGKCRYVSLDELYNRCDAIIYHCPLTELNYHMLSYEQILKMKEGVFLVNPARGGLWDYEAVLKGIENGRIAGAASDVYEYEKDYLRKNVGRGTDGVTAWSRLRDSDNFIYTAHTAFYTDTAIKNMVETAVNNLCDYAESGQCANDII